MRHLYDTAARFTGVLLIITISSSAGFVRGAARARVREVARCSVHTAGRLPSRARPEAGCAATADGKAAWLRGR